MLNLYKIERIDIDWGYDEYISAVVVAANEHDARYIHPINCEQFTCVMSDTGENNHCNWVNPKDVLATYIGSAASHLEVGTVIVAEFKNG